MNYQKEIIMRTKNSSDYAAVFLALIYDFKSWEVGGTYYYNRYDYYPDLPEFYPEYYEWEIYKLDTIQLNDGKYYQIAYGISDDYVINTIGYISGVFSSIFDWPTDGTQNHLLSYYRNGTLIYGEGGTISQHMIFKENNCIYVDESGQVIFHLDDETMADLKRILIYSSDGKLLKNIKPSYSNTFSIQNIQSGIYLYQLVYSDTNEVKSGKFIKK